MNRDEMLRALRLGRDPLELSIQKWQDIVNGAGLDQGGDNCALCETHEHCSSCPILLPGDRRHCLSTPYLRWRKHIGEAHPTTSNHCYAVFCNECLVLAKEMLAFLEHIGENKARLIITVGVVGE